MAPTICSKKVGCTLIDGGAGLNLITPKAFELLQGAKKDLQPSRSFHRVLPGSAQPLGRVSLPVTFGSRDNFCTEHLVFDVADIDLPYNATISRPSLNKFMAASHYAYLTVKIPGPKGVIVEQADISRAVTCLEDILAAET